MHLRILAVALFALLATTAAAFAPGSAMPDLARQYAERQNCHGAYDVLVAQLKGGTALSEAELAWAKTYEANSTNGQPCPAPPEAVAKRATNRVVVTAEGHGKLVDYYKQKDAAAAFEAAYAVLTGKVQGVQPQVGFQLLQEAVALGDPNAQFFLAMLHIAGNVSGKADYASALPLIEQAAQAGHVDALFAAGNFHKEGIAGKADKKKAFDDYRQAAERGHLYAAIMAFYMIQDGEGTRKDFGLAYRIARNLADQGEAYGAVLTASALLQQRSAKENENEVLYWMDVAIRDGDAKIKAEVGKLRPRVVAAYQRANAPPEYQPRVRKQCPMKTVCLVNHFSGLQSCTTNKDYWNDCDF